MQQGFEVDFKYFNDNADRLTTSGARAADMPEGLEPAIEIPIEYRYPIGSEGSTDVDVVSRLIMICPQMKTTSKGIQPPRAFGGKVSDNAKPAVQVVFDMSNPDHRTFVGTFGNQYEFTEDADGRTVQIHADPTKSTGCLGQLYDWCIEQYAIYLASKKGRKTPSPKQYEEAYNKVLKKFFWMRRTHADGPHKGEVDEKSNPMRFFKLMSYRPGTPEANSAKFFLPTVFTYDRDGNRKSHRPPVDTRILYGRPFIWTPFLSFRRIFDGAKFSVTMEVTEAVVNDILEAAPSVPVRSARLMDRLGEENPAMAAALAEKYRLLQQEFSTGSTDDKPSSGIKIDDVVVSAPPPTEALVASSRDTEEPKSETRPRTRSPAVVDSPDHRDASPDPDDSRTETSSRKRPTLPRRKD